MGRHKINKDDKRYVVSCYLSPSQVNTLDRIAEMQNRSRSNVIEIAIIEFIKKYHEEENNEK